VVWVSLFVWLLPLDLTGIGGPTSSYATTGIALRVSGALKPHHHDKVGTHRWGRWVDSKMNLREMGWGGMDWIDLAHERGQWRALVKMVMNLQPP
jgi:hypothetical protein